MASWYLRCQESLVAPETDSAWRERKATTAATAENRFPRLPTYRAGRASNAAASLPRARASSACRVAAWPIRRAKSCGREIRPVRRAAPCDLTAFARGLFVKAGLAGSGAELGLDFVERDAAGMKHDQKMIKHVGGLSDDAVLVLADRGDGGFNGLFTELFGALGDAAVEQLSRVGNVRAFLGAGLYTLFQIMKAELGHLRSLASPDPHRESKLA